MTGEARAPRFTSLQVGRGLAALLVVMYHSVRALAQPSMFDEAGAREFAQNLNAGVDFFFVLSGFIIAWVHWPDLGQRSMLPSYAAKRFLRVFPPYWGLAIPLALFAVVSSHGTVLAHKPAMLITSLTLLPWRQHPMLGVAWTLTFEIVFYCLFACAIWFGRRALIVFAFWAITIIAARFWPVHTFPGAFVFNFYNLEFIAGLGIAIWFRHGRAPRPLAWLIAGVVMFAACLAWPGLQHHLWVGRLAFGSASALIVIGTVQWERDRVLQSPVWLVKLGNASYSLYLTHPVTISLMLVALRPWTAMLKLPVVAGVMIAAAVAVGVAYNQFAEPALIALARRLLHPIGHLRKRSDTEPRRQAP